MRTVNITAYDASGQLEEGRRSNLHDGQPTATAMLDLFVDGAILEAFANDGEAAMTATHTGATVTNTTISVTGHPELTARVSVVAWEMEGSIT